MTQKEAHKHVLELLNDKVYTQVELAEKLNKTRQTINSRVKNGDWRGKEIDVIKTL